MSGYYHFESSRASVNKDEPVYTNLFITTWTLPNPLKAIYGSEIIGQQIKNIKGLDLDKVPAPVEQHHKFTSRQYSGSAVDTKVSLDMEFEVNVDGGNLQMYPYQIMKAWARLQYDPSNGFFALKKDYTGSIRIQVHMKDGAVIRDFYFSNIFLAEKLNGWDLEYKDTGIYTLRAKFVAENPKDLTVGAK